MRVRFLFRRRLCLACASVLGTLAAMALSLAVANGRAGAQEPAQATKEHEVLKLGVGVWEAEMKFYVPGMEPMTGKGEETNRMIGDLWLVSEFQEANGAFMGHATVGYDPAKKKYVGTWVDSMSSHIAHMEGTYDEKTKTMTVMVDTRDFASGKPIKQRHVTVHKSPDLRELTIHAPGPDGKEAKLLEIVYKRKK